MNFARGCFPSFINNSTHFSSNLEQDQNPGPAYNPVDPSLYRWRFEPKYSVRIRTRPLTLDQGPGPSTEPTPLDVYKPRAPKFPMFKKAKELSDHIGPGPNAYDAAESKMRTMRQYPAYTHRTRYPEPSRDKRPGPFEYDLLGYVPFDKSPAYTIRQRQSAYMHVPILPTDNC